MAESSQCDPGRSANISHTMLDLDLRPLTARSVLLSLLLGTHPPELPVRTLVRMGELFGIADGTIRVALSRMATDGDVSAKNGTYRLSERLVARQHHQDEGQVPVTRPWTGEWILVIVDPTATELVTIEQNLTARRYSHWYDDVWARPSNLVPVAKDVVVGYQVFFARPDDDAHVLVERLWDLPEWSARGRRLLQALETAPDPATRFTVAAAVARHLGSDPLLPDELLPAEWAGPQLREAYARFSQDLAGLLMVETSATVPAIHPQRRPRPDRLSAGAHRVSRTPGPATGPGSCGAPCRG